jgi:hypothetical protein
MAAATQTPDVNFNTSASQDGGVSNSTSGAPSGHWKSKVTDLIYWRDIQRTAVLFISSLLLLLSFVLFSALSVMSYTSLVLLTITLSFRIYKDIKAAIYKTGSEHPFRRYLDMDISLSQSANNELADNLCHLVSKFANSARRLFLVEDMIDSLKFYALLYLLTYVGAMFNVTTIVIIADVALFTIPKTYEVYKVEINQLINAIKQQIKNLTEQVKKSVDNLVLQKKKKKL